MENISSKLWLIKPRKAFPVDSGTAGSFVYGGWELGDAFCFGWPSQSFKVSEMRGGVCAHWS